MNATDTTDPTAGAKKSPETKRDPYLSKDGKWRKVPKVPNLLTYVSTGAYFGKLKVGGKQIRQSLQTTSLTVAKARLPDFIKKHQRQRTVAGTMGEARQKYFAELDADHVLSPQTKKYYRDCIKALFETWPDLDQREVASIREADCQDWAKRFSANHDEQYFNNTLTKLRHLLKLAGYDGADNPAKKVKRLGVKPTELHLPTLDQFKQIVAEVATAGSRHSKHCADLIHFLAFSGCRISEARTVTWADVDLDRGTMKVRNAKTRKQTSGHTTRSVPIIAELGELLQRLKQSNPTPEQNVCAIGECEKSLTNACKRVGAPRLTHHDLRHFFATRCIESGVDIPTVSRWLGHSDGGALAMRVYGHLRDEHSVKMAQKVSFTANTEARP